jgi:hypothetical protein
VNKEEKTTHVPFKIYISALDLQGARTKLHDGLLESAAALKLYQKPRKEARKHRWIGFSSSRITTGHFSGYSTLYISILT